MRITGDGLDAEHLDYGYACTVHRAQGATVDRAHVLAAGGGRELAYVALSRARHHTRIYATADNLAQAVDDLYTDWNQTHHQRWITDTPAQPGHQREPPQRRTTVVSADEPLLQERRALARVHLAMLQDDHRDLRAATGRWADTPKDTQPEPSPKPNGSSCTPTTSHSTRRSAAENDAPPPEPSPSSSAPSPARRLSTTRCAHLPSHNSTPTSGPLAPRSNTSTLRPTSSASNGSASGSPHRQSSPISVSRSELLDSYLRYLTSQPSGPGQHWLSLTRITERGEPCAARS